MFFICSTDENSDKLIMQFNNVGDEVKKFIVARINIINSQLKILLKTINDYDYVVITSSTLINHLSAAISMAYKPIFITVGETSANKINHISSQILIYPTQSSGVQALCHQRLFNIDFLNKKILILEGNEPNEYIKSFLTYSYCDISCINIYKVSYDISGYKKYMVEYICGTNIEGIIITSSGLVEKLFTIPKINSEHDKLIQTNFFTIHNNIKDKLISYGVKNVFVTKEAQIEQLLSLTRHSALYNN